MDNLLQCFTYNPDAVEDGEPIDTHGDIIWERETLEGACSRHFGQLSHSMLYALLMPALVASPSLHVRVLGEPLHVLLPRATTIVSRNASAAP